MRRQRRPASRRQLPDERQHDAAPDPADPAEDDGMAMVQRTDATAIELVVEPASLPSDEEIDPGGEGNGRIAALL